MDRIALQGKTEVSVRSVNRIAALWIACVLMAISSVAAKEPSTPIDLRDVNGVEHRQSEWESKRAVVIFFTTVQCPLSNGYVPEMNRIQKDYASRGVAFYAVEADPTIADNEVRKHAKDFQIAFPMLLDKRQSLVRLSGATATPEVAVLSNKGTLLYLGRIDNRAEDIDKRRTIITEHDLRDALDAVLAGRAAPRAKGNIVGCAINLVPLK